MARKAGLLRYLQRIAGYSLTADVREQCLFFLYGDGCNGKSTYLGALREMQGDYGMQSVPELLMLKAHESHPTERADLFGKRFVATIETEDGKRMAESLMKQMTGGEIVKARHMKKDFFDMPPTWKIFLAANHKPAIRGTDLGVWRRIKVVPFTETIKDAEKDKTLPDKLRAEMPGILAWAVAGCMDWQREGLAEPEEVQTATETYRAEQDSVGRFIEECCAIGNGYSASKNDFTVAYQAWCKRNNEAEITSTALTQALGRKGIHVDAGKRRYLTVMLRA